MPKCSHWPLFIIQNRLVWVAVALMLGAPQISVKTAVSLKISTKFCAFLLPKRDCFGGVPGTFFMVLDIGPLYFGKIFHSLKDLG